MGVAWGEGGGRWGGRWQGSLWQSHISSVHIFFKEAHPHWVCRSHFNLPSSGGYRGPKFSGPKLTGLSWEATTVGHTDPDSRPVGYRWQGWGQWDMTKGCLQPIVPPPALPFIWTPCWRITSICELEKGNLQLPSKNQSELYTNAQVMKKKFNNPKQYLILKY